MDTRERILREAIEHFGREAQRDKAVEEMAELIRALVRDDADNIAEEMADVRIMLGQLEIIYGNRDAVRAEEMRKLRRLKARMAT